MISGKEFRKPGHEEAEVLSAEIRAWDSFFHSGKVEDYIRYAQLKRRESDGSCAAGAFNAGKDPGADH